MAKPVPVTKWKVGEDFVSKVFLPPFVRYNNEAELVPTYSANGLKQEYYITLRRSAQAFGLDMKSDIFHREMNDIEFTVDKSPVGMIRLSLDEKTGKTGEIELFSLPLYRTVTPGNISDIKYIINSFIRNPSESVSEKSRKQTVSASTLVRGKLNAGPETSSVLTGKITEFLGSPTLPPTMMGVRPKPAPSPAETAGRRRKTRKHRSRRHKKTRKH